MPRNLIVSLLMWSMLATGPALGQENAVGVVETVQLLDATQLGGGDHLVLVFNNGQGFRLPGQRSLAVGPGVRVSVDHLSPEEAEDLPEACSVRVVAVPIERDGEEVMQEAERPFEVYRNESAGPKC